MAKAGRPSTYNESVADEIVRRMIEGENLTEICRDPKMPPRVTVYSWFDRQPEFYARCARAREALADYLVDEIDQMAAETTEENYQSMKVKISTKQWRAMKIAPKRYGDKLDLTGDVKVTTGPTENLFAFLAMAEKKVSSAKGN